MASSSSSTPAVARPKDNIPERSKRARKAVDYREATSEELDEIFALEDSSIIQGAGKMIWSVTELDATKKEKEKEKLGDALFTTTQASAAGKSKPSSANTLQSSVANHARGIPTNSFPAASQAESLAARAANEQLTPEAAATADDADARARIEAAYTLLTLSSSGSFAPHY